MISLSKKDSKRDEEYIVTVSGVKDTGLSGKYWSDLENLPPRRRCTLNDPKPEVVQGPGKQNIEKIILYGYNNNITIFDQ